MIEMIINVFMEENFNIRIINEYTEKSLEVNFVKKEINAYDIYSLFSYSIDAKYIVKNNCESIREGNEKDYYQEILTIIENIADELNQLNENNVSEGKSLEE